MPTWIAACTSWDRAPSCCGTSNALAVGDDQAGIHRTWSKTAEPLTVARWPITFQSSSTCTPGASRSTKASTRRPASSSALTPIQRAEIAPVQ